MLENLRVGGCGVLGGLAAQCDTPAVGLVGWRSETEGWGGMGGEGTGSSLQQLWCWTC